MSKDKVWNKSFELNVSSPPAKIWQAFIDTANWNQWNSGVNSIQIEGPFVTGTWFSMELPEGDIIRSQLVDVVEEKYFIDETWVGETLVKVEHRIEALHPGQSKLIYAISTQGPDAQAFGEGVSSDFPDVMTGLAKYLAEKMV
ncbi:SRPBCC domain-containing protein [Klebsiella pneumoniae]|uniref:SRPBCC domain-containing protein n=1 Tax=Klebsiella pneumoniae TaxID=573 RepID=UPI0018CB30AA|nr:SRPBCC domain-containing protein [Klebsiella pneumoniae]MCM5930837.1 SRPBCC domain-containing protein [Klebsiella pneumoniae]MDE1118479.1 SRPBCC domain-containing protein [Klebsiella pneumoniae]MDZ0805244.1 SRPBCC domain-containing protein [Klebsiella pneumoniae]QPM54996.1 SRPBCC domain-containing protein [Klebsiella pneumoniae]QPM60268.1 SRPBCC domain-containing protein [Klebsiella pneumoniae]